MTAPPTALIAEDEPLLAEHLRQELARLWPGLEILAVAGDGLSALRRCLELRPQVAFLDIRMPGLSGLEVAAALAEDWPDEADAPFPLLVFVTAYDQYAVQAFDRQAADYLLKPVDARRLASCIQRLQARLAAQHTAPAAAPAGGPPDALTQAVEQLQALTRALAAGSGRAAGGPAAQAEPVARLEVIQAQVGHTVHLLPVDEVLYFEAADKYLRVVTADQEHLIRMSIRELLPQLDAQRFWQVHRGTVVQARAISRAVRDEAGRVTLQLHARPEKLVVSRLYAQLFKGM
jgi:DNA-binding LytR/AlgR family response regulator